MNELRIMDQIAGGFFENMRRKGCRILWLLKVSSQHFNIVKYGPKNAAASNVGVKRQSRTRKHLHLLP
ncbi:hypothetical protein TcWFU_004789 [Taenia crassiceps]|uniref:Uncharacterized protein n=1 Tax=Taenia crassiceps TaxID=6207 RepID=A0ABR4QR31_9CEST